MMDGKTIRRKLIGNDEQRAVSPVIGVILMVAITVILAAVIAAFVLDMGSGMEKSANAGVNTEVDNSNNKVTVSVKTMGNAEKIILRGDVGTKVDSVEGGDGTSGYQEDGDKLTKAGSSITLNYGSSSSDSGTITVVAVTQDGTETQITSQDFNFA